MRSVFFIGRALAWGRRPDGGRSPGASASASGLYHHVVVLDRDRHGLSHIGAGDQPGSRLHRNVVPPRAHARRITPGLAGAHVEFPAMPGAADDLAGPGIAVMTRSIRFYQSRLLAVKEAAAPVRAAIVEREKLAAQIEHHDRPPVHLREPARAGRNVGDRGNHMLGHQSSRLSAAKSRLDRKREKAPKNKDFSRVGAKQAAGKSGTKQKQTPSTGTESHYTFSYTVRHSYNKRRTDRYRGLCACGEHAWAVLTRGYVTLVSPEDAHHLRGRKWFAEPRLPITPNQ